MVIGNQKMFQYNYKHCDDHQPGYVYLMIAKGYHGWVPGCIMKRCKIGLSRSPEQRVRQIASFEGSQPPCDIEILMTVYVSDMLAVERRLHKRFNSSNVTLKRSREWFDLWIWEVWLVKFLMKYKWLLR